MRKPLIELSDLHRFANKVKSQMWGKQFYDAAQQVIGIAASPLEVAGILLLNRPRRLGGAGFTNVHTNDLTPLSISAQSIAGQKVCYGDIVIVNSILMKAVILEIQGEVIHGSGAILDHDAERMTALQHGIRCTPGDSRYAQRFKAARHHSQKCLRPFRDSL